MKLGGWWVKAIIKGFKLYHQFVIGYKYTNVIRWSTIVKVDFEVQSCTIKQRLRSMDEGLRSDAACLLIRLSVCVLISDRW